MLPIRSVTGLSGLNVRLFHFARVPEELFSSSLLFSFIQFEG